MAKLIKGDIVQNIITDGDVIVTSPSKIGKTLDEVLVEQQSDIDRLKSNVKYIYAYGGVGGSGSGGSGSGSGNGPISILITLNGVAVNKSGSTIILDGAGRYTLYVKVSNAGGKNLFMGYTTNGSTVTDSKMTYPLNGDNKYRMEREIQLDSNGVLNIAFCDDEGNNVGDYYSQKYIVDSDKFDVTLNYEDADGNIQQYVNEPYECFVSDFNKKNRCIKIGYSIFLPEYDKDSVNVECSIDGVGKIYSGADKSVEIPLNNIKINDESILQDKYLGTYTLNATLTYTITGSLIVREKSFMFSIIPSGLFVNVRAAGDVLYDSIDLLEGDVDGDGEPSKYISQGSSLMLYSKVFEGSLGSTSKYQYDVIYKAFDAEVDGDDYIWNQLNLTVSETLKEQVESNKGVAITFSTPGIKKIEVSTVGRKDEVGIERVFKKYVYVKPFTSSCKWYNEDRHVVLSDNYFRANQGADTYNNFPQLSSGDGVMSLLISSDPIELSRDSWSSVNENVCTSISFGIQVSNINSENAKILDIYTSTSGQNYEYSLRTERLFTEATDEKNKIAIPTEILNKYENSQYHLVQIIRNYVGQSDGQPVFVDSLYIDGMLESVNRNTSITPLLVKKLVLNNINICYNLINIQYISPKKKEEGKPDITFNPDGYAYQYWLSYKEKYVNSNSEGSRIKEEEIFMMENMHRISFDGTNVVINGEDSNIVVDIAKNSDLPTVVFGYNCNDGEGYKTIDAFMNMMWEGRPNGEDISFLSRKIDLYWIPAKVKTTNGVLSDYNIKIPSGLTDSTDVTGITGNWEIDLQGTSTRRNRIKNYSLRIKSNNENGKILFSPNFNIKDNKTFLPDIEWTIKADIADSAHANNTSIGKFVNDFCTPFDTNIPDINDEIEAKGYIKNALEGIPVLLYFMCTENTDGVTDVTKIYYFGIYNFNLGRTSHYNLGYTGGEVVDNKKGRSDFVKVFKNIKNETVGKYATNGPFTFAVGEDKLSPYIAIGEIQDNYAEFDFHQYHESLLFNQSGRNIACMFGTDDKITASGSNKPEAKNALSMLVKGIAKAGKYCFQRLGRSGDFKTSADITYDADGNMIFGDNCINRYNQELLPDTIWQKQYVATANENGSYVRWEKASDEFINVNENDLKNLITRYEIEGEQNKPILNFTSAAEYYTICMAFGMVDSVLKNMNLKNFRSREEGNNFYCAFYDMDCALEEANDGEEKISYLAATDYWYSNINESNYTVSKILKKNDYWDSVNGGHGFDFTSSYLFAVVKYAKAIFGENYSEDLSHYPQNFWAMLRRPYIDEKDKGGGLQSADYFIKNYFKSGITTTFEYLASLNYRVKYLYKGEVLDANDEPIDKFLANAAAFNGSRRIKVKNWLSKRLRFMDLMMNVNDLSIEISNGVYYPGPGNYGANLNSNNDITILHSAFDTNGANTAITTHDGVEVSIYAPKHTPFIFRSGSDRADMYLLPGGIEYPNKITLHTTASMNARFFGSGLFTSVDKIETMFTAYRSIVSDNIEKITYGGTTVFANTGEFIINAKSATEIKLDIPNMGGKLSIDQNCQSLMKLNIANSNFYGEFNGFTNLQEVNISGVSSNASDGISVSGSNYLTGEKFHISGSDEKHKTSLTVLNISGVKGNFRCENTNIDKIRISNSIDKQSEFYISGDKRLTELSLTGFRKVHIDKCVNLTTLNIDDALEELYINLEKSGKDEITSQLKTIYLNKESIDNGESEGDVVDSGSNVDRTGIFDFTNYSKLRRVTLMNCDHLEHVKLPDRDIETDGMNNNANLMWIDTGILPAFRDVDNTTYPNEGYIEGVGDYSDKLFPIYSKAPKLILCSESAFYNCPNYAMLRSDWDKGVEMIGSAGNGYIAYTNIIVSDECTSLANTFCISGSSLNNDNFNMNTAIRFIEKCVPDDVKCNITSLSGCFKGRKNVTYTIDTAATEKSYSGDNPPHHHPMLVKYASVNNISGMYDKTGVTFVSKNLLDLPFENNNPYNELNWDSFISNMTRLNIANDALYNISYRLRSYSRITFNIYEYKGSSYVPVGENDTFRICDFFHPFNNNEGKGTKTYTDKGYTFGSDLVPYNNVTSFETLNFTSGSSIDFRGMFKLFPNIQVITSSFNGNLSNYNIDGLLKPCEYITTIRNSFCDDLNNTSQKIDLFEFFNWEGNTLDVECLFEGLKEFDNGFRIYKYITFENFKKVLQKIVQYTKLTFLTNIFSYCTITGYDHSNPEHEIKFEDGVVLNNIINISNLFDSCTSDSKPFKVSDAKDENKGIYTGGVLNIGRSFFKHFPNVVAAQRTLANTYLSSPLTYDYFCRRRDSLSSSRVCLSEDKNNTATLYEYSYNRNIINLKECFYNTKFVKCRNWFDKDDEKNIRIDRNYIISNGETIDRRGFEYYIHDELNNVFTKKVLNNDAIDDCLDNYTDFVSKNFIQTEESKWTWYNHDLSQDIYYYGNNVNNKWPFNPSLENNNIQETYCCLPPDFFYACRDTVDINNIFANSNIIGVIPRNLTKTIKNTVISNVFKNVNIMPNLEYYYDAKGGLNSSILNEIKEYVDNSDNDIISDDYTVVFRDEYGILKKRKPVNADRNLGQFVYVPSNFTTSDSITNMFNFRYNLPKYWIFAIAADKAKVGSYKTTKDLNDAISRNLVNAAELPYHSQYYLLTEKCVNWNNLREAKSVFITNGEDVDFGNMKTIGRDRSYYDGNNLVDIYGKNTWTDSANISLDATWSQKAIESIYMDLGLCGRKNEYNMIVDYGCPISVLNDRIIHLDNFISGYITIFLNGRVFYDLFEVNQLKSTYHKSSSSSCVIDYAGRGKNIILPKFTSTPDDEDIVFIPIDKKFVYYDFMVDGHESSLGNYVKLVEESLGEGKNIFETRYNKYTFK
jgi:hypothetical protein